MTPPRFRMRGFAVFAFATSLSSAQVLVLDFGPTTTIDEVGPPDSRINSPYHTATGQTSATTWNTLGVADVSSGLLWANGTPASGVTLNLGATTAAGTSLGLASVPSNGTGLTGSIMTSGVYAGMSPARAGIFTASTNSAERAVGLRVGGLAASTYQIYITGRNTNTSAGQVQNFYAGVSSSSDFTFTRSATSTPR